MNELAPILVTLLGMETEVRLRQPSNAETPIDVTLLGMVIDVKPEQSENLQLVVGQWIPVKMVEK